MKILRTLLCLILIFNLGIYTANANSNVAYVYDGDTLTLSDGNKVRLVQIDTPEVSPAECYGKEARDLLKKLIGTSSIRLIKEPLAGDKDDFGRLLRYVNVSSRNLNLELVKLGAAAPWFYKGQKGRFSKELLNAARTAQKKQIGLWKACPTAVLDPSKALDTGAISKENANIDATNESNPSSTTVSPGAFCSKENEGNTGFSAKGIQYTCKTSLSESRLRWRR